MFASKAIKFAIFLQIVQVVRAEVVCNGDDWKNQKDCEIIKHGVMDFKFKSIKDVEDIKHKLQTIKEIRNGIHVDIPDLVTFDYLPNVNTIKNEDGPAIKFSNHQNFQSIKFKSLTTLSGKPSDFLFENDKFMKISSKRSEDLLEIYFQTQPVSQHQTCSDNFKFVDVFYHDIIVKAEFPQYYFYIVLFLTIIFALSFLIMGYKAFQARRLWKEALKKQDGAGIGAPNEEHFDNVSPMGKPGMV
ncbi:unnamed protein product [Caenorhabditis angaria]|uniref:Receptor L-domain domain-containing protein n=1 Tax=Caenorhabditis angaria TaxID=860376 RepID=A0A9P1IKF0_9PELO|nr:unnamed protein product [Caenorhabditis angaria]